MFDHNLHTWFCFMIILTRVIMQTILSSRSERAPTIMVHTINPLLLTTAGNEVCLRYAQNLCKIS